MQSIEIPDKAENEIRIFLRRDGSVSQNPEQPGKLEAKLDAMEKMFLQFTSNMQKGMRDLADRMNHMQDLLETVASNQQQQHYERRDSKAEDLRYEISGNDNHSEQAYRVLMHDNSMHSQEVQILDEEDEEDMGDESAEYILDEIENEASQEQTHDEGEVTIEVTNAPKRRNSSVMRSAPKIKRIKSEMIPIQNYADEAKQASDDLIHIVESVAACESIQSNVVDSEEVINTSTTFHQESISVSDIRIQPNCKYELISVTEELDFDFPITSIDELKRLNDQLNGDSRMVVAMKHKLAELSTAAEYNFQKALQKLVADAVMHQLNWQGLKGKIRMKDMKLFGELLYQTWFQHIDVEQYEELLRIITKKAHKRYSKTLERRRHRMQGGPNRIIGLKQELKQEPMKEECITSDTF